MGVLVLLVRAVVHQLEEPATGGLVRPQSRCSERSLAKRLAHSMRRHSGRVPILLKQCPLAPILVPQEEQRLGRTPVRRPQGLLARALAQLMAQCTGKAFPGPVESHLLADCPVLMALQGWANLMEAG